MSYRADKQVIDTHTLTDTQTGAMTIPEGQYWPRVIISEAGVLLPGNIETTLEPWTPITLTLLFVYVLHLIVETSNLLT